MALFIFVNILLVFYTTSDMVSRGVFSLMQNNKF